MDETETDDVTTVGQRLREAREAKGLSVEDIAAQTRIPTRHLTSLEEGDWEKLPAATYSIGFAKNYAGAVGLDRTEISEQLRAEMGGVRPTVAHPEVYEAADPARTMPKGLVIGALALLLLFVLAFSWLNSRSLEPDQPIVETENVAAAPSNAVAPAPSPVVARNVTLTAKDAVWLQVKDGTVVLKQGLLAAGERYEVPANAANPVLTTGKPEALAITVGTQQVPPIGTPGRTVSAVSLKAADLLRTAETSVANPQAPANAVSPTSAARQGVRSRSSPAVAPDTPTGAPPTREEEAPQGVTNQQ